MITKTHKILNLLLITYLSIGITTSLYAKPNANGFQEMGELVQVKNLIPHLVSNENYVEKYTFDANLTDSNGTGGRLYFSISINNIGAGDHKLHAKGTLSIGEETFKWNSKKSSDQWQSDKKSLNIKAGGVTLSGGAEQLLFKVKSRKQEFEIKFTPQVQPWRPKNGGVTFSKSNHKAEFALFPMAELEGTWLTSEGQTISVKGRGWGRHSWSHLGPHEWSKWSQLIRIFDAEKQQSTFIRRIHVAGNYKPKVISYVIVTSGKEKIFEGYDFVLNEEATFTDKKHSNHYAFPTRFTIQAKDQSNGAELTLKLNTKKRLYRRNPIAKLSWVKRKIVEMVTKPMEYAYYFDYNLAIKGSKPFSMTGEQGRYEVFHLN